MTTNSVTFKLSREELFAVMAVLGLRGMPGFGTDAFSGLNQNEAQQAVTAGINGLRARDLLQDAAGPEGKPVLVLDEMLMACAGACATAPRVLFINRVPLGGPFQPWYVHMAPYLTVIHRSPVTGVDEMFASVSAGDVLAEIGRFLALAENSKAGQVFSLANDTYEAAVDAVQAGQPQEAGRLLSQAGLDADAIQRLIQTIVTPLANTTLAYCELKGEGESQKLEPAQVFSLLQSADQTWMMCNPSPAVLQLQPVAKETVLAAFQPWFGK